MDYQYQNLRKETLGVRSLLKLKSLFENEFGVNVYNNYTSDSKKQPIKDLYWNFAEIVSHVDEHYENSEICYNCYDSAESECKICFLLCCEKCQDDLFVKCRRIECDNYVCKDRCNEYHDNLCSQECKDKLIK